MNNRIRELRLEKKKTQKEIALMLGVSPRSVGFYETGERDPDTATLLKLSEYFNVSIDYLLMKNNNRNSYPEAENFLNLYISEMKKSGFDLSDMTEEEIIEDVIKTMKAIKELNK